MTKKTLRYIIIGLIIVLILIFAFLAIKKHPKKGVSQTLSPDQKVELSQLRKGTLILWSTSHTYDGNLGGREGADKICQSEVPSELGCSNIHAFISIKTNDDIKDFPKLYNYRIDRAVYWYNKSSHKFLLAANNWKDLLDGTIINSPDDGIGTTTNYWIGSQPDGSLNNKNCHNWEANGPTMSGAEGRGAVKDARWLGKGSLSCGGKDNLLCICQK